MTERRYAPDAVRDLITSGQDHLRVDIELQDGGVALTAAAAHSREGERRLTADGAPLADSSRWREMLPLRTFVPDDLRLIKGSPRRRREYLDTLASRCEPEYLPALRRYEEALSQRNALLRAGRAAVDDDHHVPWEKMLARTGLAVTAWRAAALASFIEPFQRMHAKLTGEMADTLHLTYRTNVSRA